MITKQQEQKFRKIANRLTDRFYRNLIGGHNESWDLRYYEGLNKDILQELINATNETNSAETFVSHVCGGCFEIEKLKRTVLNFLSNRIFYYSRQQNANPNSPRVHARKKEIEYLLKEINNIFIDTNKRLLGESENNVMSRKSL